MNHPNFVYPGYDRLCFRGPPSDPAKADGRNAVVMSNTVLDWDQPATWTGMLDRSPCGTGTSAVMACMYARKELQLGQPFRHESIVGSVFTGVLLNEDAASVPGKLAVVPTITGSAHITQYARVVLDPTDPFPRGYTVGDIW